MYLINEFRYDGSGWEYSCRLHQKGMCCDQASRKNYSLQNPMTCKEMLAEVLILSPK